MLGAGVDAEQGTAEPIGVTLVEILFPRSSVARVAEEHGFGGRRRFWQMMNLERQKAIDEIPVLVSKLQMIVGRLEELFPGRHFTLDGHLVGSIAEVIASYMYDLELLPSSQRCHDGRCQRTGVNVQIKGTQRKRVAMYGEADHLIVLRLANGQAEEVYNGPGLAPWLAAGPMAKNGQRSISVRKLRELAQEVPLEKRLALVRPIGNSTTV